MTNLPRAHCVTPVVAFRLHVAEPAHVSMPPVMVGIQRAAAPRRPPHVASATGFFSIGATPATRYAVGFDRLLRHFWRARSIVGPIPLRRVHFLDDLILVAACLDGVGVAWRDLADQHERALVRHACSRQGPSDAVVQVRRALYDLRGHTGSPLAIDSPLAGYTGRSPAATVAGGLAHRRAPREHDGASFPSCRIRRRLRTVTIPGRPQVARADGSTGEEPPFLRLALT